MGDTKTMHALDKNARAGPDSDSMAALWPGNFPRTSCFERLGNKCHRWVHMGANGFAWVWMHA